jgi:transketolase
VGLATDAAKVLAEKGIKARVVSMPSTKRFDAQPQAYKDVVLPADVPKMAVEAGVSDSWYKYVGLNGEIVGMDRFGESAPAGELFKEFGFTVDNVVAHAETLLEKNK